jgi:hypothetical protein
MEEATVALAKAATGAQRSRSMVAAGAPVIVGCQFHAAQPNGGRGGYYGDVAQGCGSVVATT